MFLHEITVMEKWKVGKFFKFEENIGGSISGAVVQPLI
jgi:hypothetical protein